MAYLIILFEDYNVMNAAAKVIKFDHVTELNWLPVRQRIVFKTILYTFKALYGVTPTYLTELVSPYVPRQGLRSADQPLLERLEGFVSVFTLAPEPTSIGD